MENNESKITLGLAPLAKPNPKHYAEIIAQKDFEMQHVHGGNALVIVQELGDEMLYCGFLGKGGINYFALVFAQKLKPRKINVEEDKNKPARYERVPITGKELDAVNKVRAKLKSGKFVIQSPRMVPA